MKQTPGNTQVLAKKSQQESCQTHPRETPVSCSQNDMVQEGKSEIRKLGAELEAGKKKCQNSLFGPKLKHQKISVFQVRHRTSSLRYHFQSQEGPFHGHRWFFMSQRSSLVVQWLSLHTPNAGWLGSLPSQGTKSHMPQLRPSTAK